MYRQLRQELQAAKSLLILGDNAGEIAFDLVLVETLQREFPQLKLTYCVRGGKVMNDATREDAAYVGMDKLVEVIDNGAPISGTELAYVGDTLQAAFDGADVILPRAAAILKACAAAAPMSITSLCASAAASVRSWASPI